MGRESVDRCRFLTAAGAATVAGASGATTETRAADRTAAGALAKSAPEAADKAGGYIFFKPTEAYFIEAAVDHMIPADNLSPSGGTALGVAESLSGQQVFSVPEAHD